RYTHPDAPYTFQRVAYPGWRVAILDCHPAPYRYHAIVLHVWHASHLSLILRPLSQQNWLLRESAATSFDHTTSGSAYVLPYGLAPDEDHEYLNRSRSARRFRRFHPQFGCAFWRPPPQSAPGVYAHQSPNGARKGVRFRDEQGQNLKE